MTEQEIVNQLSPAIYMVLEAGFFAGFGSALALSLLLSFISPRLHVYIRLLKFKRIADRRAWKSKISQGQGVS